MVPRSASSRSVRPAVVALISLFVMYPLPGNQVAAQQAPAHHSFPGFSQPEPIDFNDHNGFTQIFDGKTLNGWDEIGRAHV